MAIFKKNPKAVLDYGINWTTWLDGDTISTSEWTVPSGITKDSDRKTNTTTTIWLSGGTVDTDYDLVCHIVTAQGREDDRTITVMVRNR